MRALAILLALALGGCMDLGFDQTSSGGGKWAVKTYHPCYPPKPLPIGGNTGEVGNTTDDGGTVGTTHPEAP